MKIVNNNLFEFKKGLDPVDSMGLGRRAQIEEWLKEMIIEKYVINRDLSVDILTSVYLDNKGLVKLPEFIQFGTIYGNFFIDHNNLTTLRGCPYTIYGSFSCSNNKLTSLEYAPKFVNNKFWGGKNTKIFSIMEVKSICIVGGQIYT